MVLFAAPKAAAQTVTFTLSATGDNGDRDPTAPGLQVHEGDTVTVTLDFDSISNGGVIISGANYGGTATQGQDYSGSIIGGVVAFSDATFIAASNPFRRMISITNDTAPEGDETITLTLMADETRTTTTDTVISPPPLTITIRANDGHADQRAVHLLTITGPATLTETDSDFMSGNYTVTRTGDEFTESTTVSIAVTHTTTSAADISVPASVTFAAGDDTETFQVTVRGDALNEASEMFSLRTAGSGLTHAAALAVTITDNDDITSVTVADAAAVQEGASTDFTVTLDHASAGVVTVDWTASIGGTMGGTPSPASGNLQIPAGMTSADLSVGIPFNADLGDGASRMLTVSLGTVTIAAPGRGTVTTSDTATATVNYITAAHTISIADATVTEGAAEITVTRTGPALTTPAAVTWTVAAGSATVADFTGAQLPTGTVTFAGASTSETIRVPVADDALSEADEDFTITLSAAAAVLASNMQIALGAAATITITDNDAIDGMSMTLRGPATVNEERAAEYTVDLGAEVTGSSVTVAITAAGTAMSPRDYSLSATTITIAAGSRSGSFTVTATNGGGDDTPDRELTLTLTATGGANTAAMAEISRVIAITEDDPAAREARLEAPLASAGRGVGLLAVAAVQGRLAASAGGSGDGSGGAAGAGNSLTIAGRDFAGGVDGAGAEILAAEYLAGGYLADNTGDSATELLRRSSFNLAGGSSGRGFNFWGGGGYVSADGDHDGIDYDGDTSAFTLGIDTGWQGGLIGVAVSRSDGDTDFTVTADGMKSTLETEVTSVHPYVTRRLNRSQLWLTAGHGSGDAELVEPDARIKTDLTVTTAAFGITHAQDDHLSAGLSALYTRAKLDAAQSAGRALPATSADSLRVAASGQARWTRGAWSPFADFTVRHDSGDGDTGIAGDLGGGIEFRAPAIHIRLAAATTIAADSAEEHRATLVIRKSSGNFDLSLNLAADNTGLDTARLLTGEWRF